MLGTKRNGFSIKRNHAGISISAFLAGKRFPREKLRGREWAWKTGKTVIEAIQAECRPVTSPSRERGKARYDEGCSTETVASGLEINSWPMYTSVHHRELLMDGIASLLYTSQNNHAPMAVEKILSNPKRSHSSNSSTETGG